jgi:V8-like Glu-specific endopeptidase
VWLGHTIPLIDAESEKPLWLEHDMGGSVDVALIPLKNIFHKGVALDPRKFNTDLDVSPSEPVSIVGFPFGLPSNGKLPIWKTGHIASDVDADYNDKPVFLIDATTRHGMSGSPVLTHKREFLSDDRRIWMGLNEQKFLGVFSGGVSSKFNDIEIGMVWKPRVIEEILENRKKS